MKAVTEMRNRGLSSACSSHVMLTDLRLMTLLLVALESRKGSPLYYRASDMPTPNDLSSITEDTGVFHPFSITIGSLSHTMLLHSSGQGTNIHACVLKTGEEGSEHFLYSSSILFFHSISD